MANDANSTAQELFKLLMNAASSRRGSSADKKPRVVISKEEREYQKQLKKRTEAYKADDAARKDRAVREKVIGRQYEDLIKKVEAFGVSVKDATERAKNLKELEKIPEAVSKAMSSSSSSFVKQMASQAKTLEGVFRIENIAKARQDLISYLSTVSGRNKISAAEYQILEQRVKAAGVTFNQLGISAKALQRNNVTSGAYINYNNMNMAQLTNETKELSLALGKSSDLINSKFDNTLTQFSEKWKQQIVSMGSWVNILNALKNYRDTFEKQRQYSALDVNTIDASRLGVSLEQLTDQVVDSRMTLLAMQNGGKDAMGELRKSISSFRDISSSPEQALKDLLGVQKNISKFGVAQQDLTGEVEKQIAIYKSSFAPMGYSVEQFNELTNHIVTDIDTRKQLAGLQQKERKATIEALQARYAEIQAIYGAERAMEIFKKEQQDATLGPLERRKKAAYSESVFAALGMSKEGGMYRKLVTDIATMQEGPAKEAAQAQKTALESAFANKLQEYSNSPDQQKQDIAMSTRAAAEMIQPEMLNFVKSSTIGTEGSQVGIPPSREPTWIQKLTSNITSGSHQIENITKSSTVQIAAGVAALAVLRLQSGKTNSLLTEIRDVIKRKGPPGPNTSGGIWDALTDRKGTGNLAKTLKYGTRFAGLAGAGFEAYQAITSDAPVAEKDKALGGAAGGWVGAETGAALGTMVAGPIGTVLGGAVGFAIGTYMGNAAGAKLGTFLDKHERDVVVPAQKSDSVLMHDQQEAQQQIQRNLQTLQELLKQQTESFKIQEEQHKMTHEQAEQQLNYTRELIKATKSGLNNNKEAIEKQTTDLVKKNIDNVSMRIQRLKS